MEKIIKQCMGIDVSQNELDVSFGTYGQDQSVRMGQSKRFKNSEKGFVQLLSWALKQSDKSLSLFFVMESTGVYHEQLACFLYDQQQKVIVVLPSRASHYSKTLEVKTVTDKQASISLTRMGLEKKMALWVKPDAVYMTLKQLTREREQLQKAKTVTKNQVHAEEKSAWPNNSSLARARERLRILESQVKEIEEQIRSFIAGYPELERRLSYVMSIKGIGLITAATVVGETNGFGFIQNKRQLVSYSGYDVVRKDSGTSVHSRPRISKKGNRHIRKAMHFPALSAIRHEGQSKAQFIRMVEKHGIKMKAAVAIQRKLLVLMYTLWKKEEYFNPEYVLQDVGKEIGQLKLP